MGRRTIRQTRQMRRSTIGADKKSHDIASCGQLAPHQHAPLPVSHCELHL